LLVPFRNNSTTCTVYEKHLKDTIPAYILSIHTFHTDLLTKLRLASIPFLKQQFCNERISTNLWKRSMIKMVET